MYLAPCGSDDSCNFKKTTKPPGGLAEDSTCLKGDSSPLLQVPGIKGKITFMDSGGDWWADGLRVSGPAGAGPLKHRKT